jgi:hypothetical protein
MKQRNLLFIGSNYGGLNFYNEDGTALSTLCVCLHNKVTGRYYIADYTQPAADGVTIDAAFSATVTSRMTEGNYALEVFTDSAMATMVYYDADYCTAVIVAPTPGQTNDTTEA